MSAIELFTEWARTAGCDVEVTQENDGGGYTVLYLTTHEGQSFDITVTEPE